MSVPQLEPQPIGQRPTLHINNPAKANKQLHQIQFGDNSSSNNRPKKRAYDEIEQETNDSPIFNDEEEDNDPNDTVRLWEEGWRERYYKNKFNIGKDDIEEFRIQVAQHYARGLCWVLQYYYQGAPAWDWYFPYHYAPFASDFLKLKDLPVFFDKGTKPFKPLEQLMAVFPSQSRKFLPIEWQSLMIEKESPIIDFYPLNFCVDLNGKRHEWQGVALLPFVDEKRLHCTLEHIYSTLTIEEKIRNKRDYDRLYIHSSNLCYDYFKELYVPGGNKVTRKKPLDITTMLSEGMAVYIWSDDNDKIKPVGEQIKAPLANCEDIINNQVICVKYRDLSYDDYIFKAKLLENVTLPEAKLKPRDYDQMAPYQPNLGFAQRP
jgi:5'-3' exoribonuclease 2